MLRLILLFCFVFLAFGQSNAQVVNIENQRLSGKEKGWAGNNALTFAYIRNLGEIWQVGNRFRAAYFDRKHTVMFMSDLNFVKANERSLVNDGFEHIRYSYTLKDSGRVSLEAFKQLQYNRIFQIRLRSLYGAGIRVRAIDRDSAQLSLGVTPMLEFEDVLDGTYNRHFRLSMYFAWDIQFNKSFGINMITYYQPDMLYWKDYRLNHETSLRAAITRNLDMRVIFTVNYDEFPPAGIPQSMVTFRNALNFRF